MSFDGIEVYGESGSFEGAVCWARNPSVPWEDWSRLADRMAPEETKTLNRMRRDMADVHNSVYWNSVFPAEEKGQRRKSCILI